MAISRRRLLWLAATGGTGVAAGVWRLSSGSPAADVADRAMVAEPTPTPTPTRSATAAGSITSPEPSMADPDSTDPAPSQQQDAGEPTPQPTTDPTTQPTTEPTTQPTTEPTTQPTTEPTTQPTAEPPPEPTSEPTPAGAAAEVICRDALAVPPGTQDGRPHTPTRLMLHHTAVSSTSASQAPGRLRAHTRYHQQQGWPTIAYHYAVDLRGNLYELRDVGIAGDTFTSYDPAGWFLVVCEGDFNATQPTDRLLDGVATMFAHGAAVFGIDPATLAGHRDHAATTCPGDLLYAHRDALVAEVQRRLGTGGATLPRICGDEADRRVAAIEAGED